MVCLLSSGILDVSIQVSLSRTMSQSDSVLAVKLRDILDRLYPPPRQAEVRNENLTRKLEEFIAVLRSSLGSRPLPTHSPGNSPSLPAPDLNVSQEDLEDLGPLLEEEKVSFRQGLILLLYALIAAIAILGNILVIQLVVRSRRLHTVTHGLLANLAVADLLMATLNIPFSAARVILSEWPFGDSMCRLVPWVQVTSVYVTSFTMTVIALDRLQVILHPLGSRLSPRQGALLIILIWTLAAILSAPYALYHDVVTMLTVRVVRRCRLEMSQGRTALTIITFTAQYAVPLLLTALSYATVLHRLARPLLGFRTAGQMAAATRTRRRTIKMLVGTVIAFAVCWAPIHVYHLATAFHFLQPSSTTLLITHLLAMSSSSVNPFIYCWLNEHFRCEALKWLRCFRPSPIVHPSIIQPPPAPSSLPVSSSPFLAHPTHRIVEEIPLRLLQSSSVSAPAEG